MGTTNPALLGGGVVSNQSVYEVVTEARHRPGTQGCLSDGRRFEYVRSDQATAIGKGQLATYEPQAAASDQLAIQAAVAIGATSIPVTVTITLTANELVGGFIAIESTPGEAEMYGITGHAAHGTGTLTLEVERPVVVALTTGSDASLIHGPTSVKLSAAVVANASPVEAAAGVPLVTIPIGSTTPQYAWIQKTGLANVLFGTVVGAVGDAAYHGENVGSFQASVDTSTQIHQPTLAVIVALLPVDTEYFVVRLGIE